MFNIVFFRTVSDNAISSHSIADSHTDYLRIPEILHKIELDPTFIVSLRYTPTTEQHKRSCISFTWSGINSRF